MFVRDVKLNFDSRPALKRQGDVVAKSLDKKIQITQ